MLMLSNANNAEEYYLWGILRNAKVCQIFFAEQAVDIKRGKGTERKTDS